MLTEKMKDERRSLSTGSMEKYRYPPDDTPTDPCFDGVTAEVARNFRLLWTLGHQQTQKTQIVRPILPQSPWQALMVVHGKIWAFLL